MPETQFLYTCCEAWRAYDFLMEFAFDDDDDNVAIIGNGTGVTIIGAAFRRWKERETIRRT